MELPGEWPEPVVSVQSLSDSGLAAIPGRYVRPPSQRPAPCRLLSTGLPVIDLGGLTGETAEFQATIRAVSEACREWGFFQVVNHGVSPDLMRRTMSVWREFYLLPLEEKRAFANSPSTYEGYGSRVGVEKDAVLDWGDYFFLNILPLSKRNYDKWPAFHPSFRETLEEYGQAMVTLADRLTRVLSISLGLEPGRLQEAFGEYGTVDVGMRVNYYPRCPQPDLTLGLSPHSDPGGLTILLADDHVMGLQVRKEGSWVNVQPVPGAFVVNIGDQIQVLCSGIYKSVEHRAVVNSDEERLSIAVFYNPKGDMPIGPVPELVNKGCSSSYSTPMTFNEYRLFIRTKGPRGKLQLESLEAIQY